MSESETGNVPTSNTGLEYKNDSSPGLTYPPETQMPSDTPLTSDQKEASNDPHGIGITSARNASEDVHVSSGVNLSQDSSSAIAEPDDDNNGTEGGSTAVFSDQGMNYDMVKRSRSEKAKKRRKSEDEDSTKKPPGKYKLKRKKEKDELSKIRKKKREGKRLSSAQAAVEEMTRNILEEDKYSQKGSIVDTDSSDDDDDEYVIYASTGIAGGLKRGNYEDEASLIRLDRSVIARAARKRLKIESMKGKMDTSGGSGRKRLNSFVMVEDDDISNIKGDRDMEDVSPSKEDAVTSTSSPKEPSVVVEDTISNEGEETSIFGQTTGSANATWVECDKCKKWRRLRGVVDAKKLPPKWFCSMNKNDPDRAKCSAPEEEYEAITPETISDQRARKHLRLWVRRIKCNEDYESRMPTMTRGKRRNVTSTKEPYEWIRCCNPSCGKWRAVLRSMDASSIIDASKTGEWYCVLNTWDEKTASCAAPQENLPAIGCPPWVMEDEE